MGMPTEELAHQERDYKMALASGRFEGQFYDWRALDAKDQQLVLNGHMTVKLGRKQMASESAGTHDQNMSTEKLLSERHDQHGDWLLQSKLGYKLKETMKSGKGYSMLEPHQREALDMIQTKVSRILTGDANFADHWDDIAGYALLGKGGHK